MVFFVFSLSVLALKATAHVGVGCDAGECTDASQVKPRAGSAMLQKRSQANLAQEKVRNMRAKSATGFVSPQDLMTCDVEIKYTTTCMTKRTYDDIVEKVGRILDEELEQACNAENCEQADWAGCVLRMAGHDFMDHIDGQGGSDACTDMDDGDNAGLPECLSHGEFNFSLNSIYPSYCGDISLADFVTIAAQAVMSLLATEGEPRTELAIGLRNNFLFGRTTLTGDACQAATHWSGNHLLPNPAGGCGEVERVFVTNMGLSWKEATALMGVHSLGRAKIENSGFDGYWDTPEHSRTFNSHYYVNLIATSWCPELNVNGNTEKHQWKRCDIGTNEFAWKEMMLNTDMCLAFANYEGGSLIAGEDTSHCCTWVHTMVGGTTKPHGSFDMEAVIANNNNSFCNVGCGETFVDHVGRERVMNCFEDSHEQAGTEFFACCPFSTPAADGELHDCQTPGLGHELVDPGDNAPAIEFVRQFAADEMEWVSTFLTAWKKATENGFDSLQPLADSCEEVTVGECPDFCSRLTDLADFCNIERCAGCDECR